MMTQAQLATASLNDIVFDGRNKEYGAYELRALYERHVRQALGWASLVLLLLLLYPVVSQLMADAFPTPPAPISRPVEPMAPPLMPEQPVVPVAPPPVAPPPATAAARPTVRYTEFVAAKDDAVKATDEVPDVKDLVNTEVGVVTFKGGDSNALPTELPVGPGDVSVADVVAKPQVFFSVEQMPEMLSGGGLAGIVAAIQKAARYPGIDLRNGIEGRVHASFIVNPLGEITEIKIVRGLSPTLDAETIRAIGTLPRLKPGKQNGQAVNVAFNVPITYTIQ